MVNSMTKRILQLLTLALSVMTNSGMGQVYETNTFSISPSFAGEKSYGEEIYKDGVLIERRGFCNGKLYSRITRDYDNLQKTYWSYDGETGKLIVGIIEPLGEDHQKEYKPVEQPEQFDCERWFMDVEEWFDAFEAVGVNPERANEVNPEGKSGVNPENNE